MAGRVIKPEEFPPDVVIQCIKGLNNNSVEIRTDSETGIITNVLISKIYPGELFLIPGWFWDHKKSCIRCRGRSVYNIIMVYTPEMIPWAPKLP